jgi:hypothetical protein
LLGYIAAIFSLSVDREKVVKAFQKKFLHSFYSEKKIPTKLRTQKKNSCRENLPSPPPRISNGPPLTSISMSVLLILLLGFEDTF